MKGSQGEATSTKQAALSSTIKGNETTSEVIGTITTETIDKNK